MSIITDDEWQYAYSEDYEQPSVILNATQTEAVFWRTLQRHAATAADMLAWFYANVDTGPYYDVMTEDEGFSIPTFKAVWYRVRDALVAGQMPPAIQQSLFAELAT